MRPRRRPGRLALGDLGGLAIEADAGVLVATVELGGVLGAKAEGEQGVADLVGVGTYLERVRAYVGDEGVEALTQVAGVGGLADEREEGLAEAALQGSVLSGRGASRPASSAGS